MRILGTWKCAVWNKIISCDVLSCSWWWSLRAVLDMANKRIYNTLLCACISKFWCCKMLDCNDMKRQEKLRESTRFWSRSKAGKREATDIMSRNVFSLKIKKCVSLLALLITSETRQFHWKLLDMVTPNMWFWQQVQGPRSWRIRRRNGVGSLEVNNQFFTLIWVHLKIFVRTLLLYFCYSALDCTSTTFGRWEHAA